jgi:hypothetical protein
MKRRETRGRDGKRFGRAARDRGSWWRVTREKPIEFQRQL